MSFFLVDIYIEFCTSLTVKVLCADIEFSQLVKSFADRFYSCVNREKDLCIVKKICHSRKRFMHREKDLSIVKKICAWRKRFVDHEKDLSIAKKFCALRKRFVDRFKVLSIVKKFCRLRKSFVDRGRRVVAHPLPMV